MKTLCIIPARGGSKRIPRKNIKDFLGKPIIAYSIEAALKSDVFDEVMVSTDDEEIAEISRKFGASVPFLRSSKTANDVATTKDVIEEVIEKYKELGSDYSHICCLYSTAPFVTSESLKQAFSKLIEGNRDCIFPAVAFSYPIQRSLIESKDGKAVMKWPEFRYSRSQDLEPFYHDAGQFYFYTKKYLEEGNGLGEGNCEMLILSELEVQDLDTIVDWKLAEMKYKIIHNGD